MFGRAVVAASSRGVPPATRVPARRFRFPCTRSDSGERACTDSGGGWRDGTPPVRRSAGVAWARVRGPSDRGRERPFADRDGTIAGRAGIFAGVVLGVAAGAIPLSVAWRTLLPRPWKPGRWRAMPRWERKWNTFRGSRPVAPPVRTANHAAVASLRDGDACHSTGGP